MTSWKSWEALVARTLASGEVVRAGEGGYRRIRAREPGLELLADLFGIGECLFLRFNAAAGEVALRLSGGYGLRVCAAGGWLLAPQGSAPLYWLPRLPVQRHALFYWAEALVHWCMDEDLREARGWLAEALLDLRRTGQGLPPALLGANPEVQAPQQQLPLPDSGHADLVVANLGHAGAPEYLLVNLGNAPLVPSEGLARLEGLTWRDKADRPWSGDALTPGAWLLARGDGST